jgi:Rieske Fe-S protein
MKTSRFPLVILMLVALVVVFGSVDALAQKKKAVTPPPAAEPQRSTAPQQVSGKSGGSLKDVLVRFKGEHTTLGVLKQVEMDYIVVDEDGTEIIYPIAGIRSLKVLKIEEDNTDEAAPKLEIKLQ